MNDEAFQLLMLELKGIKEGQTRIEKSIESHVKDDAAVHKIVDRHSTYFKLMSPLGLGALGLLGSWVKDRLHL